MVEQLKEVRLKYQELWAIHLFLRRGKEQESQEYSKELMIQVYQNIIAIRQTPNTEWNNQECILELSDADLWQCTRLIDRNYSKDGRPIGEDMLIKVFAKLVEDKEMSSYESEQTVKKVVQEFESEMKERNGDDVNKTNA